MTRAYVKDLNQEPGIFSARYANSSGGWFKAMEKIYERVKVKKPTFSAKFVCSLSLKFQDEKIFTYSGEIKEGLRGPQGVRMVLVTTRFLSQKDRYRHMVKLTIKKKF